MPEPSPNRQPVITTARGRQFACSPAAVLGYIVDAEERFLMLSSHKRPGFWEVVNGGLEANETLLEGALREVREEAGPHVEVRPLGVVHALTFQYDEIAQFMISVNWLFEYLGGPVEPGDDMAGSTYRWWTLDELSAARDHLLVPNGESEFWLFERALQLFRLYRGAELPPIPHPSGGWN
jgi:8-oxo-dGTP pyrophosphatase MutT (NUDIX family)